MTAAHGAALQVLLNYYERDTDSEICLIPHRDHQHWQNFLPTWLKAGLIAVSSMTPKLAICSGCGDAKRVESEGGALFYRCFSCKNLSNITPEESTLYEISLMQIAAWLQGMLQMTGARKNIITDRVIDLGKRQFEAGKFAVYLLRGTSQGWPDGSQILSLCQPESASVNSLLIVLDSAMPALPANRMVTLPLAEIMLEDAGSLTVNVQAIEYALLFAYKGCKGNLREKNEAQFKRWLRAEINAGKILPGEKTAAVRQAKNLFDIGRDTAQGIWDDVVPAEYSTGGRPRKPS